MIELMFGVVLVQLFFLANAGGGTKRRPRRVAWVLPMFIAIVLFAIMAAAEHRLPSGPSLIIACAAFAALLFGMIAYLVVPRSQR